MRPKLVVDEAIGVQVVEFAMHSAGFPGMYLCQSLHFMLLNKQLKEEVYYGTRLTDVGSREKN